MQGGSFHPPAGFRGSDKRRGRARPLTILLVFGLGLSGGAAGVLAGQPGGGSDPPSAAIAQYAVPPPEVAPEVVPEEPAPTPEVTEPAPEPESEERAPEPPGATTSPAEPADELPFTGTEIMLFLALLGSISLAVGLGLRRHWP